LSIQINVSENAVNKKINRKMSVSQWFFFPTEDPELHGWNCGIMPYVRFYLLIFRGFPMACCHMQIKLSLGFEGSSANSTSKKSASSILIG
jgi:hypothetical protein